MLRKILLLLIVVFAVVLGIILLSNHFMVKFALKAGTLELRQLSDIHRDFETRLYSVLLSDNENQDLYEKIFSDLERSYELLLTQTGVILSEIEKLKRLERHLKNIKGISRSERDPVKEPTEEKGPRAVLEKIGIQKNRLLTYILEKSSLDEEIKVRVKALMDYMQENFRNKYKAGRKTHDLINDAVNSFVVASTSKEIYQSRLRFNAGMAHVRDDKAAGEAEITLFEMVFLDAYKAKESLFSSRDMHKYEVEDASKNLSEFRGHIDQLSTDVHNGVRHEIGVNKRFFLAFSILFMMVIMMIFFLYLNRKVIIPVRQIKEASMEAANGIFRFVSVTFLKDEVRDLAQNYNHMVAAIKENIRKVIEYSENLEEKVRLRTREIETQKKQVDKLIDSIPLGILTIENNGLIGDKYSPVAGEIFEINAIEHQKFEELFLSKAKISKDQKDQISAAIFSSVGEDALNFEINKGCLVRDVDLEFADTLKSLELSWACMEDDHGCVEKIIVCVNDVTKIRSLEKQTEQKQELLERINKIIHYNGDVISVLHGFENLLVCMERVLRGVDEAIIKTQIVLRYLHTLKGNARSAGFSDLAEKAHIAEGHALSKKHEDDKAILIGMMESDVAGIRELYKCYLEAADKVNLFHRDQKITVDVRSLEKILSALRYNQTRSSLEELRHNVSALVGSPLQEILAADIGAVQNLARDLGKADLKVEISGDAAMFRRDYAHLIRDIFGHILRNSVCHGIEGREERLKEFKDPSGLIRIHLSVVQKVLHVAYSDDGRGLDLKKIREQYTKIAGADVLDLKDPVVLAEKIFGFEVSTSDGLTKDSGRGLGMGAVRNFVKELEGDIHIILKKSGGRFIPFELQMTFPDRLFFSWADSPDSGSEAVA